MIVLVEIIRQSCLRGVLPEENLLTESQVDWRGKSRHGLAKDVDCLRPIKEETSIVLFS